MRGAGRLQPPEPFEVVFPKSRSVAESAAVPVTSLYLWDLQAPVAQLDRASGFELRPEIA